MKHYNRSKRPEDRRSHWGKRTGRHDGRNGTPNHRRQPNSLIAWRSLEDRRQEHGSIRFEPAARRSGTFVTVEMHYSLLAECLALP